MSIPGIKNLSAHVIVSEIGVDLSRFPSAAHVRAMTRAPANVDPIVSVKALIGLRLRWFSALI
jgi:hypothetical protein